jgi:hypothetical protein
MTDAVDWLAAFEAAITDDRSAVPIAAPVNHTAAARLRVEMSTASREGRTAPPAGFARSADLNFRSMTAECYSGREDVSMNELFQFVPHQAQPALRSDHQRRCLTSIGRR